jgi:hypothetical protein
VPSSAIGDYIPQISSNCSRFGKFSDIIRLLSSVEGHARGFVLTSDAGLTSLIQDEIFALNVLARFSANVRGHYYDLG